MSVISRCAFVVMLLIALSVVALHGAQTQTAVAQPAAEAKGHNVVMLVRELEPMMVAFKTATALQEGKQLKGDEIVIVV